MAAVRVHCTLELRGIELNVNDDDCEDPIPEAARVHHRPTQCDKFGRAGPPCPYGDRCKFVHLKYLLLYKSKLQGALVPILPTMVEATKGSETAFHIQVQYNNPTKRSLCDFGDRCRLGAECQLIHLQPSVLQALPSMRTIPDTEVALDGQVGTRHQPRYALRRNLAAIQPETSSLDTRTHYNHPREVKGPRRGGADSDGHAYEHEEDDHSHARSHGSTVARRPGTGTACPDFEDDFFSKSASSSVLSRAPTTEAVVEEVRKMHMAEGAAAAEGTAAAAAAVAPPPAPRAPLPQAGRHVVLVIGETGSGKSTFINMLANFFRKGSLDNIRVAIPTKYHPVTEDFGAGHAHTERAVGDVSQSQTDACTPYKFNELGGGIQFHFIDTPGLSDTRGHKQDEINIQRILDAAARETHLTAIVVVINGSVPRELLGIKAAMTRFRGSLPDVVLKNIMAVFTNTDEVSCNFPMDKMPFQPVKTFFMRNSAFSTRPADWTDKARSRLAFDFQDSLDTVGHLLHQVSLLGVVSSAVFKSMLEARNRVKAVLHKAQSDMVKLQQVLDQLSKAEESMQRHGASAEQFKDYTQMKRMTNKELVDAPYHSTICSECTSVCHENCGLSEISEKGSNSFKGCAAFGGADNCRNCEGRCSYTLHYHARKTVQIKEETMEEILHDVKSKYDTAVAGRGAAQQTIKTVGDAKKAVEGALQQMKTDLEAQCRQLKSMCTGFNLVDELYITLEQLRKEAEMLTNVQAKRDAMAFVKSLETLIDTLNVGAGAAVSRKPNGR